MSRYFIVEPPVEVVSTPIYNYGSVYSNIYNELQQIESELSQIRDHLSTMASNSTTVKASIGVIAEKSTAMETYQRKLKELGESSGIRIISPYEAFSFVTSYRSLIEEGRILKWRDAEPSDKDVSKALNDLERYIEKIRNNVPRAF
jgi:hypothetical protein